MNRLTDADLGRRVVVRVRLDPSERPAGGASMTDLLGVLERIDPAALAVRRADGSVVEVPPEAVVAAKPVPPRPVARREVRRVQAVAAEGWPGLEQARLGGWLLRAGGGFTSRANSCLPLDDPDRPLAAAVDDVTAWYAARGLPPRFQVPTLLGSSLDPLLAGRGWPAAGHAVVLTGAVPAAPGGPAPSDGVRVVVGDRLDAGWLSCYHYRGGSTLPPAAPAVLAAVHGSVGFARASAVGDPDTVLAIGRGSVSTDAEGAAWLGLAAVEVVPQARRAGLGRRVVDALLAWGAARGARRAYLQVVVGNTAATRLYEGLGFAEHHRYHYREPPNVNLS